VGKATNNIDDLESQKQQNQEQQSSYEERASGLEESKTSLENLVSSLNSELSVINDKITDIQKQIDDKNTEMQQTKDELEEAKLMEQKQYDDMKLRIRFMYEMGDQSYFEILFTGDSIADSLNKAEYVSELVSYDRKMIDKFKETKQLILEKEETYSREQEELLELKDEMNEQQKLIATKIEESNERIKDFVGDIAQAEAAALEYEKKVEADMQAINDESRRIEESSILEAESIERASREQASIEQASREESIRNAEAGNQEGNNSEEETTTPYETTYTPQANDLDMLAALIECEAGDQSYYGMLCVGAVVMNRINSSSFPDTLYEVLYQPYQFTPVTVSGRFALVLARGANETCYNAAREVLEQGNIVGTWLFFRMNDGSREGEVIGDHVFY
jgi:spore germination cell wall hydrolase CwlJ-like protein